MGRVIAGVVAAIGFLSVAPAAHAGFMFNSGTLNASASASGTVVTATPVTMTSAAGGTASASIGGNSGTTTFSMKEWTGVQPKFEPALHITGSAQGSSTGGGSARGIVTFTESATETFNQSTLDAGFYLNVTVTIKNSANQTVADFASFATPPTTKSVTLTPDTYTLEWSLNDSVRAGTHGGGNMDFALFPEPTSLALLALPASALVRRRRGCCAPVG